jgi:tRNA G37 N-methylase Trm5
MKKVLVCKTFSRQSLLPLLLTPLLINSFLISSRFHLYPRQQLSQLLFSKRKFPVSLFSFGGFHSNKFDTSLFYKIGKNRDMTSVTSLEDSPVKLDKERFTQTIPLLALKVPVKLCSAYLQRFQPAKSQSYLFNRPRCKRIFDLPENHPESKVAKLLLLEERITSLSCDDGDGTSSSSSVVAKRQAEEGNQTENQSIIYLPKELLDFHHKACREASLSLPFHQSYPFTLTYDHFTAEEVLKTLLSSTNEEIVSSFETIGHIAHINLRDDLVAHRFLIGQVILDKNPNITLVVNKIGNIETKFRTFPLEIIASSESATSSTNSTATATAAPTAPSFVVTVKENDAYFTFNFAEVYWNSRLQYEHCRLIDIIRITAIDQQQQQQQQQHHLSSHQSKQQRIVFDMMAGVGPFAIPLAMTNIVLPSSEVVMVPPAAMKQKGKPNQTIKIHPLKVYANGKLLLLLMSLIIFFFSFRLLFSIPFFSFFSSIVKIDLNPISYKYLCQNREKNKCNSTLHPYNLDGR